MPTSAGVARCASLVHATRNSDAKSATGAATVAGWQSINPPMTGCELRAQLRAQLGRNARATQAASSAAESCASRTEREASELRIHARTPSDMRRCNECANLFTGRPLPSRVARRVLGRRNFSIADLRANIDGYPTALRRLRPRTQ